MHQLASGGYHITDFAPRMSHPKLCDPVQGGSRKPVPSITFADGRPLSQCTEGATATLSGANARSLVR